MDLPCPYVADSLQCQEEAMPFVLICSLSKKVDYN